MLRAVLFDLDGTLLDIDLESFLRDYFSLLGPALSALSKDLTPEAALAGVLEGTSAMSRPHPGHTNAEVFEQTFERLTGVVLSEPEAGAAIERFYRETFPALGAQCRPRSGAASAVNAARSAGFATAVATNPIFPEVAILERLSWTELPAEHFVAITTYEKMYACKPSASYFRQVAEMTGFAAHECLMVGDDPILDMSAADAGMKTFYVGEGAHPAADWSGSLDDLAGLLPRLAL